MSAIVAVAGISLDPTFFVEIAGRQFAREELREAIFIIAPRWPDRLRHGKAELKISERGISYVL